MRTKKVGTRVVYFFGFFRMDPRSPETREMQSVFFVAIATPGMTFLFINYR